MWTLKKIISGGQTGADMGGLRAGKMLGVDTGGFAPKGWKTERGPKPELAWYGLVESGIPGYPHRTSSNVRTSDGTVIFGDVRSSGSRLTLDLCDKFDKPFITNPDPELLRGWCQTLDVRVLNVAGNRASKDPEIEGKVIDCLMAAFSTVTIQSGDRLNGMG